MAASKMESVTLTDGIRIELNTEVMFVSTARKVGRQLISDADFNRLLMDALSWATEYMEGEEALAPHILAFYAQDDGTHNLVALVTKGWKDYYSKKQAIVEMGFMAAEYENVLAAAFIVTEAWMTQSTSGELPAVLPSDDPERVEVVVISGATLDKRQNQAIVQVERRNGRLRAGEVTSIPFIDDGGDQIRNSLLAIFLTSYSLGYISRRGGGVLW